MNTKINLLCRLLLVTLSIAFMGCSEEIYDNQVHSENSKYKNEVSFKQFKQETKIKNFQTLKSVNFSNENSREIENEFVIDTVKILKYTSLNDKDTYSFKIYPITENLEANEYYNLVYEKIGNEWNELIFKNTEKENPQVGEPKLESSEMVYNRMHQSFSIAEFCEVITYSFHCTCQDKSNCDLCSVCVSTSVSYVYCGNSGGGDGDNGSGGVIIGNPGGGDTNDTGIYIPNPYEGEEDLNNPSFVLAMQVSTFTRTLPTNLKNLIRDNYWLYPTIVDFMRNNDGLTPENKSKAINALNNFLQIQSFYNPNATFIENNQFKLWAFNYFLHNPTVTIQQFKNWFSTQSVGVENIESQNSVFWNNPNLTFPQQSLPTFDDFYAAYPSSSVSALQLCTNIGDEILTLHNAIIAQNRNMNTCAVRLSYALNHSGVTIPNVPGTKHGADGKYYFTFASDINAWMRLTFGTNAAVGIGPLNNNHQSFSKEEILDNPLILQGLQGIFSMTSTNLNWSSGHCDLLFDDASCLINCHLEGPINYVDVWILN